MPLDPHCARVLKMLGAASGAGGARSTAQRRQALDDLGQVAQGDREPALVSDALVPTAFGGVGLRIYEPVEPSRFARPAMIYLHGGGWVAGGLETHDSVCRALAAAGGFKVFAVDYRRAPEHPFPAALEDAAAAVRWIAGETVALEVDLRRIVLAGDSAGGNLAASTAAMLAAEGASPLARLLLICPILDLAGDHPSRAEFAEGYFITREAVAADMADYLGEAADPADPRLSPLLAEDLSGFPPTHVHVAQFDPFRDEGQAFAFRLATSGVPAVCTLHPGMIHYFYALPRLIPSAREALARMAAEVRDAVDANA